MGFVVFLGICAFLGWLVYVVTKAAKGAPKPSQLDLDIAALPNFTPAIRYSPSAPGMNVMLDPQTNQIALAAPSQPICIIGFEQIVAVDVERNGSSLQKTNRGSQMMGAAAGGVLLGGLGLLVGGLSGSKRNVELVKRLSLKIYTNDLVAPFSEVVFFDHKNGLKPDDDTVKQAALALDEWYGRFRTILAMNDKGLPTDNSSDLPTTSASFGRRALVSE